jgi:outer membrane protein assembly factor BamB
MRRRGFGIVPVLLLAVALSGCDWLQPGFDAGRSAYNPADSALTTSTVASLTSRFTISTNGRTYTAPIVSGSHLYASSFEAGTGTARIGQFDATNGKPGWSTAFPVVADGRVYIAASGTIIAYAPSA